MTQHDDLHRLRHMYDHAREATTLISGLSRMDLDRNRILELALIRLIEIVGEAGARVSESTKKRGPRYRGSKSLACAIESSMVMTT